MMDISQQSGSSESDDGFSSHVALLPVEYFKVWSVWEIVEEYGNRGRLIGIFTIQKDAMRHRRGAVLYCRFAGISEHSAIRVGGSDGKVHIVSTDFPEDIPLDVDLIKLHAERRSIALAKLNAGDKEILGIKE